MKKKTITTCYRKLSKVKGWCLDISVFHGRVTDAGMTMALGISREQYRKELR